jgi:enoyl-[acyl-carrier-protein] reductase (NADH)
LIGYQQKFFSRVRLLLREHPSIQGARCDVLKDEEVAAFFERFGVDSLDVLVHAVAYGHPELFVEQPSNVSQEAFSESLNISVHSLCRVVRHAKPALKGYASVITLTYQASQRADPMYGLMGVVKAALESTMRYLALELGTKRIRVNAISPGPIVTVAAVGILLTFLRNPAALERRHNRFLVDLFKKAGAELGDKVSDEVLFGQVVMKHLQEEVARKCPIEEILSKEDVADCALFLGSDYSRKITGQVIYLDCGFSSSLIL